MTKKIYYPYIGCAVILFLIILYSMSPGLLSRKAVRQAEPYGIINTYALGKCHDSSSVVGFDNVLTWKIKEVPQIDPAIFFLTTHQEVKVYFDNELVYSVRQNPAQRFGFTAGMEYVYIPLFSSDLGKEVRVVLKPCYTSVANEIPIIYYGDHMGIVKAQIMTELPSLILSAIAIFIGMVLICFYIVNKKPSGVSDNILNLGLFAVAIGGWKLTDLNTMPMLLRGNLIATYMPYVLLLLTLVPFTKFIESILKIKSVLIDMVCYFSMFVMVLTCICHLYGISDFRSMLWLNHVAIVFAVISSMYLIFREVYKRGTTNDLGITLVCAIFCLLGCVTDMLVYYFAHGKLQMFYGILAFDIYIIYMALQSIRMAKGLIEKGNEAKYFEKMAFKDQMTDMYNRAYYNKFMSANEQTLDKCGIIIFDLNNLKYVNDNYGHEAGDRYIIESARILKRVYGPIGACCRIGGDEFCVLITDTAKLDANKLRTELAANVADYNKTEKEFEMNIACGYARYDRLFDMDLADTAKRADKLMYENKLVLKTESKDKDSNE